MAPRPAENRFLKAFDPRSRARLCASALPRTLAHGATLFSEGDRPDCVYLLRSGRVELVKSAGPGRVAVLGIVEPGDYFGELGVFDGSGRNTGARALGKVAVDRIRCAAVRKALRTAPVEVTIRLLRQILKYLRTADELFVSEIVRKEKIQLIGEMASSIIHDIRGPLTGIQLAAQRVTELHQDEQTLNCCRIILRQADRMVGMAQGLLDFSRGRPALSLQKVRLPELFESFRVLNEEYLRRSKVRLTLSPVDAEARVDPERLLRVLQNIVGNAVDALGADGGEVALSARRKDGGLEISVRDNGPGIPEAIRDRVFEPFVTYGKKLGTGLGMTIAKSLVEAHGGRISFTTATGRGTTFRIHLPPRALQKRR